jgi:hypothetical protein
MAHKSSDRATNGTIVRAFLQAAGIHIPENAIYDKEPPLPDVFCTLPDGSRVAFELTEAVDQEMARSVRASLASKARMCEHYRQLPLADRTRLAPCSWQRLHLCSPPDGVTDRRFDQVVPRVFDLLLGCSCEMEGNIEKRILPTMSKRSESHAGNGPAAHGSIARSFMGGRPHDQADRGQVLQAIRM